MVVKGGDRTAPAGSTLAARLRRAIGAARRELRSPPPVTWELADPRAANERFADRSAVVTGAAGRIGSGLVEALLAAGASVHAVDLDAAGLDRVVDIADRNGGRERLTTHVVDLGDSGQIEAFADGLDRVDVLVNNVGFNDDVRGPDVSAASWHRVLDVDLIGPAVLTGRLTSLLAESQHASVVFITSINGVVPSPWLHYGAAKAALAKVVVDLAHQLAPHGIRVNAVAPGVVRAADDAADRRAASGVAVGGGAVPVEAIVNAVLFLGDTCLSPMTTGQQLVIDAAVGPLRDGRRVP